MGRKCFGPLKHSALAPMRREDRHPEPFPLIRDTRIARGLLSSLGRLAIQSFLRDAASVKPSATATALIRSCSPQIGNPPLYQPIPYRDMDFSAPAVRASLIIGTEMSRH